VGFYSLKRVEVKVLRLYTGPMFNLYNAVLHEYPSQTILDLKGNKYETTLFCMTSGILKISRKTEVLPNRHLWRGLGGMILPENFWDIKSNVPDAFQGGWKRVSCPQQPIGM
jgi:hypothetical protein